MKTYTMKGLKMNNPSKNIESQIKQLKGFLALMSAF